MKRTIWASVTVGLAALMTFGCGNVLDSSNGTNNQQSTQQQPLGGQAVGNPVKIWAVDTNGALFSFFSDNPGAVSVKVPITGTNNNEKIIAIDVRPRTGVLYGLTFTGRIYWIDTATGVATLVGLGTPPAQINADIDFNPVVDRIRQEADTQNARINPADATFALDTPLTIQPANVPANAVACAYTNPEEAPASTQLFVITGASNRVYLQATPNNGQLTEVGQLPLDIGSNVGFDIAPGNVGFASVQALNNPAPGSTLLRFDPASGAATIESLIGGGVAVKSIAVDLPGPSLVRFVGIDANKNLVRFNSNDPGTLISSSVITGTTGNIVGCDFSPGGTSASGLKVLTVPDGGGLGKIYSVDLATAAATLVSTTTVALPAPGTGYGVDIQPGAGGGDMVVTVATGTFASATRVITAASTQLFQINVATGTTTALPNLSGEAIYVPAIGFGNNFLGSNTNPLFGVNFRNAKNAQDVDVPALRMVQIAMSGVAANLGGFLSQLTTQTAELDVTANGGIWYAGQRFDLLTGQVQVEDFSTLFAVGRPAFGATTVGRIGGALPIKSFAIIPTFNANLTTAP